MEHALDREDARSRGPYTPRPGTPAAGTLTPASGSQRARRPRWVPLIVASGFVIVAALACAGGYLDEATVMAFRARYGEIAGARLARWERLVVDGSSLDEGERVARVNAFFNELPWLSDQQHWGRREYWATPFEMLGTDGGDCEDYAIAKYVTLVMMGVDAARLRVTYVRALSLQEPHMVLAYYPTLGADPLILDNLDTVIRLASQRRDLIPVYSFNAGGVWRAGSTGRERRVGTAARLDRWRDLSRRMRAEGLGAAG